MQSNRYEYDETSDESDEVSSSDDRDGQWGANVGYQWGTMWNYFRMHLPLGGGVYT
jgi:hypothetical protein